MDVPSYNMCLGGVPQKRCLCFNEVVGLKLLDLRLSASKYQLDGGEGVCGGGGGGSMDVIKLGIHYLTLEQS